MGLILRLLFQTLIWLGFMGLLLFGAAGTLDWPGAWILLFEFGAFSLIVGFWLVRHDPALLRERLKPVVSKNQKPWDRVLMGIFITFFFAWLPLMGIDAKRFDWSHMPGWLEIPGALALAFSIFVGWLVFRVNSFAAPVVRLQSERRQRVITSGVYAFVRHPMYAGALFLFIGLPLLLGSYVGLLAVPFMAILLGIRTIKEEQILRTELEGYDEYARSVRWRLIPFIW